MSPTPGLERRRSGPSCEQEPCPPSALNLFFSGRPSSRTLTPLRRQGVVSADSSRAVEVLAGKQERRFFFFFRQPAAAMGAARSTRDAGISSAFQPCPLSSPAASSLGMRDRKFHAPRPPGERAGSMLLRRLFHRTNSSFLPFPKARCRTGQPRNGPPRWRASIGTSQRRGESGFPYPWVQISARARFRRDAGRPLPD